MNVITEPFSSLDPAVKASLESRIAFFKKLSNIDPSFKRIFEAESPKVPANIDSSFRRLWEVATKKNISLIYRIVRRYMDTYPGKPIWLINQMEQETNNASDEAKNEFELSMAIDELPASKGADWFNGRRSSWQDIAFRRDFPSQAPNR